MWLALISAVTLYVQMMGVFWTFTPCRQPSSPFILYLWLVKFFQTFLQNSRSFFYCITSISTWIILITLKMEVVHCSKMWEKIKLTAPSINPNYNHHLKNCHETWDLKLCLVYRHTFNYVTIFIKIRGILLWKYTLQFWISDQCRFNHLCNI